MRVCRRGFRQDGQGNVALLAALGAMVMVLAMGGALDFGRAYAVRASLQRALDAASVTSVQWVFDNNVDRGSPRLKEAVKASLVILSTRMVEANSNLPKGAAVLSAPRIDIWGFGDRPEFRVGVSLDVAVPTTFLGGFGLPTLSFTVYSQATGSRAAGVWLS